jgi:hypothetical protein
VLAGEAAGVTVTVRSVVSPEVTTAGVAVPDAEKLAPVAPKLVLRGVGGSMVVKSTALLFVSTVLDRMTDVALFEGPGAAPDPSKHVALP